MKRFGFDINKNKGLICGIISATLVLATLLLLILPGIAWQNAKPNYAPSQGISDITVLNMGSDSGEVKKIVPPRQNSIDAKTPDVSTFDKNGENGEETASTGEDDDIVEDSQQQKDETDKKDPQQQNVGETTDKDPLSQGDEPDENTLGGDLDGNEDGLFGETGGDASPVDIALVMRWYKYGTEPKTILCGPQERVATSVNTAQLVNNRLKYDFFAVGEDAAALKITSVSLAAGDGLYKDIREQGEEEITLGQSGTRNYTFFVEAEIMTQGENGQTATAVTFVYVLRCAYGLDIELALSWKEKTNNTKSLVCAAGASQTKTINAADLYDNVFNYDIKLLGTMSEEGEFIGGEYKTASGGGGSVDKSGSIPFKAAQGSDRETYYFTFRVKYAQSEILYGFTIVFCDEPDVKLRFSWLEGGTVTRDKLCLAGGSIVETVLYNKLSAGGLKYEMALEGDNGKDARIIKVSFDSTLTGGGNLNPQGFLQMSLPQGKSTNTYTITVTAVAAGKQISFTVILKLKRDVSLIMEYTAANELRQLQCENGKTVQAEPVYDDQLENGTLSYSLKLAGEEADNITITAVTLYSAGGRQSKNIEASGNVELLLNDGKPGENTFTVTAGSGSETYIFKLNIPYKHRGGANIKISTNLKNGQTVTNEADLNLTVMAWSEDENGNQTAYIPANGTDTKLVVTFDGQIMQYVSVAGQKSEYTLFPKNPEQGDNNTHTLNIYAEDAYGNYGELNITLKGQRAMSGQVKGSASIYVDMTVLGIGVIGPIQYNVLANEPVSYCVAKAVMGKTLEEPFGAAEDTLGWGGSYGGTLDTGFYLRSLSSGRNADALEGSNWPGSSEKEILAAIDARFGKGSGLATLWRCLYRNGLNKSSGSNGTYGEFDFTSGSGWMFSIGGATYYPGQSMSEISLEDGDVLTLRYTLAYGWDVGGGSAGYGNGVGYCVEAVNGSFSINHRMEKVVDENGTTHYVCACCGIEEECAHISTAYLELDDEFHILHCEDCNGNIGDMSPHTFTAGDDDNHICSLCGRSEEHKWMQSEAGSTASCTQGGTAIEQCYICGAQRQVETPPKGHTFGNAYQHNEKQHWRKCDTCGEIVEASVEEHEYIYNAAEDDFVCKICLAGHDWDYCGNNALVIESASCKKIVYHCHICGMEMIKEGYFEEYHNFIDGYCTLCGEIDQNYTPPEEPIDPDEDENTDDGDETQQEP